MNYLSAKKVFLIGVVCISGLAQSALADKELFKALKSSKACTGLEKGIAFTLGAQLAECNLSDLKERSVSPQDFTNCIDYSLQTLKKIKGQKCRQLLLDPVRATLKNNLIYQLSELSPGKAPYTLNATQLGNAFSHFRYWMEQVGSAIYRHPQDSLLLTNPRGALSEDLDHVLRALWKRVWTESRDPKSIMKEEQVFTYGLPSFTQVVTVATEQKLDGSVLFPILEQALSHFNRRSQFFSELAEFACQIRPCDSKARAASELFRLNEFFLGLDQPFSDELKTPKKLKDSSIAEFIEALEATKNYHMAFLREVDSKGEKISDLSLERVPPYARGYVITLKDIVRQVGSVGKTGNSGWPLTFGFTEENISIALQGMEQLRSRLSDKINEFGSTRDNVAKQLATASQLGAKDDQLEAELDNEIMQLNYLSQDLKGLQASLIDKQALFDGPAKSALKLSKSERWSKSNFFIESGSGVSEILSSDATYDSTKSRTAYTDIGSLAVKSLAKGTGFLAVDTSQILSLSIAGSWSPGCALAKQGFPTGAKIGPEGFIEIESKEKIHVKSQDQQSSTRDYQGKQDQQASESKYAENNTTTQGSQNVDSTLSNQTERNISTQGQRTSNSNAWVDDKRVSTSTSQTVSASFIFGASITMSTSRTQPGVVDTKTSESYSGSGKTSSSEKTVSKSTQNSSGRMHEWGLYSAQTDSKHSTKGSEKSTSSTQLDHDADENRYRASFEIGMRNPNTPFPNLPVGSLLLVQLPRGTTDLSKILDVQVARRNTVKVVQQDSDFYLVVNDCQGTKSFSNDDALTVQYSVQSPQDQLAQSLVTTVGKSLQKLASRGAIYLQSGDISPLQIRELESLVKADLAEKGSDPNELQFINSLYENWVASELAQLELRVKILQVERKMSPVISRIVQIQGDLKALQEQKEISKLTKIWALDNFDLVNLNSELTFVIQSLRSRVLPILKVRYPEVVLQLEKEHLALLSSLQLHSSLLEVAKNILNLVSALEKSLKEKTLEANLQDRYVVIRFPRVDPKDILSVWGGDVLHDYPLVSPSSSQEVWAAIENSATDISKKSSEDKKRILMASIATLRVLPEDLYVSSELRDRDSNLIRRAICSGSLNCEAAAPIVDSMALFFQLDGGAQDAVNSLGSERQIPVKLVSDIFFTNESEGGGDRFQIGGNWGQFSIPVFFGNQHDPVKLFKTLGLDKSKNGQGISPFSEFQVNFKPLNFDKGEFAALVPNLSEVMLVFKVKYRNSKAFSLKWLQTF